MKHSLPIVDSLAFLDHPCTQSAHTSDTTFASLKTANIGKVVLAPSKSSDHSLTAANEAISEIVAIDSHNRRQLGRVDPTSSNAKSEIRRCVDLLKVSGFYLSPKEEGFSINETEARKAMDEIAANNLPVVVETGVPWMSEPLQVAEVAKRYPEIPIIMTNGGQLNISGLGQEEVFMALHDCNNIYIQTAGVYRQDFIETVFRLHGSSRVLFASATPIFKAAYESLRILGAAVCDSARDAALNQNALSLFWGNEIEELVAASHDSN